MSQSIFSIDGETFDIKIPQDGIKRSAQILDSDETERLQSGDMFRDIIGKYVNYTINVDTSLLSLEDYGRLFDIITSPVKKHSVTMPYNQTMITFDAYCSGAEDTLKRIEGTGENRKYFWGGLSWQFIADSPFERATGE